MCRSPPVLRSSGPWTAPPFMTAQAATVSVGARPDPPSPRQVSRRSALTLSGGLLLVGLHPSGEEDDHEAIFTESAQSDVWVFTHFLEFVLVLVALLGLLVLCRVLRRETPYLALLAAGAILVTSATWAALQGVDGVTLKQSVEAWAAASETEQEAARFADAETVRWIEWGLQSYFRVLLGLTLLLLGAAAVVSRLVPTWLGVLLVVAGLLSVTVGLSVGYAGLESGFQDAVALGFQLVVLVFIVGLLVVGRRAREPGSAAST